MAKANGQARSPRLWFCLVAVMLASCIPTGAPTATTAIPPSPSPDAQPPPETTTAVPGCSEGDTGLFTPEDVRCYLGQTDPTRVQMIDEETAVLFADPQSVADWAGAAIIYHIPTLSMLVLDQFGFYCPGQTWTIGDITEEIAVDCMAREAGTPVGRVFFESKTIKGSSERAVQIALDGCGDIFAYKSNRAGLEYVKVFIDARAFDLSTEPITLDLTVHPEAIGAWIDV